jgi:hypothetical protein
MSDLTYKIDDKVYKKICYHASKFLANDVSGMFLDCDLKYFKE